MILLLLTAASIDISGTIITLQESRQPGAIADVTMQNRANNGPQDDGDTVLDMDDISVGIQFRWNSNDSADSITITPPDGVVCRPSCVLELDEGMDGVVHLYGWEGM